jgi:N-acyl-D-amino-acid deacylase
MAAGSQERAANGSSLAQERIPGQPPVSGKSLPGLEAIDREIMQVMEAHGVPGCQLAITQAGKLKVARGYGFADLQTEEPMGPDTHMVLASVSKVLTAQTTLKMVEQGRVKLSDRVFDWFRELPLAPGMREDPRINEITIEMCLYHTGGWNRKVSGDPSGWTQRIKRALRIGNPPTALEMIRYMKGVRLDFDPGTQQAYSNFGFVLLGAIIAAVNRQDYLQCVQELLLRPMGISGMRRTGVPPQYLPGEAHRYLLPADHPMPGGNSPMMFAAGGWDASCIDLAKLLVAIDGSRSGTPWLAPELLQATLAPARGIAPTQGHWFGMGWDSVEEFPGQDGAPTRYTYSKDGALGGISTWIEHLAVGSNFVLLFNSSMAHGSDTPGGLGLIRPKVIDFIRGVKSWPEGDLFGTHAGMRLGPESIYV